jgi:hypothetical protein
MNFFRSLLLVFLAVVGAGNPGVILASEEQTHWREDYAYMMGMQAYIYGFPAIKYAEVVYDWVEAHTGVERAKGNVYTHFPMAGPDLKMNSSVNRDTLYSIAWSFVGDEPLVFTIPANPSGRYYSIEFGEWYSDAFGYMGNRTTHNKAAAYLVHAPGWKGTIPEGIDRVLESPAPWFLVLGRTYTTNAGEDLKIAHQIQRDYKIIPLSEWGKKDAKQATPIVDVMDVFPRTDPLGQFKTMNATMKENPPPARDDALMKQFALVGLGPYGSDDLDSLDEQTKKGLRRAMVDALAYLEKVSTAMGSITNQRRVVNGWAFNPNNWGRMAESGDFLGRSATQSFAGALENLVEEAVKLRTFTDIDGNTLDGGKKYTLKFSKEQIPQAKAFWSITLYDSTFNLVANSANKYAIRDIDKRTVYGDDGSLTIYMQPEPPTEEGVNWLPTPAGVEFNLFFRAYLPSERFLDQSYVPPTITLRK